MPLRRDQYLFPSSAMANGTLHLDQQMSTTRVNAILADFSNVIGKGFTSHCFRRGGIQHMFLLAPVQKRWTLSMCRWWGGWTEHEDVSYFYHYPLTVLVTQCSKCLI